MKIKDEMKAKENKEHKFVKLRQKLWRFILQIKSL